MNPRLLLSLLFLMGFWAIGYAQQSQSFTISGEITTERKIEFKRILEEKELKIGDFLITNHAGEPRGTLKNAKGVRLIDLLQDLQFSSPSPRQLSEFYFIFEALDGYKVVFSWNELFNNPLGKEVYLVTSANGENLEQMEDSILLISKTDERTGRRHVKNLSKIHVKRT